MTAFAESLGQPMWRRAALAAAFALLAGCASMPARQTPERAPRPARVATTGAAIEKRADEKRAETPQRRALGVVAERRRGDYPEIQTDETGFTITEQVRIGGDARADYERALQLLAQARDDEGIRLLVAVTEAAPDVTAPYIDLGIAYARSGDLERAETVLETAALLSPDHPIVHNELGIVYRKTGRFTEARASYEKALAVFSDFHFARRNLAVLCDLYLADLGCAFQHYTAYLQSVVDDDEVELWVADIRNRLGQ
jgi:Flp pilus assembly protein TadD